MIGTTRRRVRQAYRTGTPLDLGGAAVDGAFLAELLLGGTTGTAGRVARLDLAHAHISGRLDLTSARIESPLHLRTCVFGDKLLLDNADLVSLTLDGSTLPGIDADGIRVAAVFAVRNATVDGDIRLLPAHINGTLDLQATTVTGGLHLQRAEIGGAVNLHSTRITQGARLTGARVRGDIDLARAHVTADPGTGIAANLSGVILDGSLLAHGLHADGQVHIIGAQVSGTIALNEVTLHRPGDHALLLIETRTVLMTLRPTADSTGTISLRDAHVGRLVDDPVTWPAGCRVELDGLTYERLTRRSEDVVTWTARQRLDWMARYATGFAPGPYDQLAAALTRDGRDHEARQVLIVRERLRHRATGRLGAAWGAVQEAGIGFGYRPMRALMWLLLVVAASTGWFAWSGPLAPIKPDESPTWDPFLYSVDVLIPLIDLGHDKAWDPVGPDKAVTLTVMAIGWILATTVVAGAGRALRR